MLSTLKLDATRPHTYVRASIILSEAFSSCRMSPHGGSEGGVRQPSGQTEGRVMLRCVQCCRNSQPRISSVPRTPPSAKRHPAPSRLAAFLVRSSISRRSNHSRQAGTRCQQENRGRLGRPEPNALLFAYVRDSGPPLLIECGGLCFLFRVQSSLWRRLPKPQRLRRQTRKPPRSSGYQSFGSPLCGVRFQVKLRVC